MTLVAYLLAQWAVRAVQNGVAREVVQDETFTTPLPLSPVGASGYSSVTVLTRGAEPLAEGLSIDRQLNQMASHIAQAGGGAVLSYNDVTGNWDSIMGTPTVGKPLVL